MFICCFCSSKYALMITITARIILKYLIKTAKFTTHARLLIDMLFFAHVGGEPEN